MARCLPRLRLRRPCPPTAVLRLPAALRLLAVLRHPARRLPPLPPRPQLGLVRHEERGRPIVQVLYDLSVLRTEASTRGIGRYVATLGEGLADEFGHRSHQTAGSAPELLGLSRLSAYGRAEITRDVRAEIARLSARDERDGHANWAYRMRFHAGRASRKLRPDVFHQGHPNATPLGKLGCPRVVTAHDLIPLLYPDRYLDWRDGWAPGRQLLDERRYRTADHVIAISETTASDLVKLLGISSKKISVVYNGVDLALWSPEPQPHDRRVRKDLGVDDKCYVLYVGAADWRKNFEGMLQAVLEARRRSPELELTLVWAASLDAATQARLRQRLREADAADAVKMVGYVSDRDLGSLFRGAVAQLFVSRAEGFGYPVVEAMAAGCPVITSNVSSMAEVAAQAAITVDPEDHRAIADAIVTFADNATERRRYGAAGVARAGYFSVERMARGTFDVYSQVSR